MPGNVALGSYDQMPNFAEVANVLGASVFKPSELLWSFLNRFSETWTANRAFLDASISRRRTFCLLTAPVAAMPGSVYSMELQYLKSKGVPISSFRLVKLGPTLSKRQEGNGLAGSYLKWFRWNELLASKHQQELIRAVHEDLSFLFAEHGARIIPNGDVPFPPRFDYGFVTVAIDNLYLRIVRGRGDVSVNVTPQHTPHDFHEVSFVLMAMETPEGIGRRQSYVSLRDAARLLRSQLDNLKEVLSDSRYEIIQQRLFKCCDIPLAEQLGAVR
jgi:hypothetical protein